MFLSKKVILLILMMTGMQNHIRAQSAAADKPLRIVFIRHGEKLLKGDNLSCAGLNRSKALPGVITAKFGIPDYVYVTAMVLGVNTMSSRMFQTVVPLVAKYNIPVNTSHAKLAAPEIAADLKTKTGTILVCWEHKAIVPIVGALGINVSAITWPDDDYDSIWIVTFNNGTAVLTKDKEGIKPSDNCDF